MIDRGRRRRLRALLPMLAAAIVLFSTAAAAVAPSQPRATTAEKTAPAPIIHSGHAIAMFGEPKYGPDFRHFDYVNPDAPRAGLMRFGVAGTFDSFNPYIVRGNAAAGVDAESLTVASQDEPFTQYGLIAERIEWPEDRSWVAFTLRPEARWHDGQPITVDDVIFSLDILKSKGQPFFRFYYRSIARAEKTGERTVRFVFNEAGNRELPLIAGQIPVLPKHYWEGRDFDRSTLEPPLGSGPYRIASFEAGRNVEVERVDDYWGKDLPVNVGQNNIDRLRFEYFRDETVLRQALKAGILDFRIENQAKAWALDYDVPAVREGWLKKVAFPHRRPAGLQAFVYNTRRPLFADARVREALGYAFDFEWTNRILFFGQYTRATSFFNNSELAAAGLPDEAEQAILDPFRGRVPDRVFGPAYQPPVTDGSGWPRDNLAHAFRLLHEAGWVVRDMRLVNEATGQPLSFEILITSTGFERIMLPFVRNLKRLGIDGRIRLVDESQYINRLRSFDFDMAMMVWGQSESPGNEQRDFWSSAAAEQEGSRNYAGIRDPVIDALIELLITAPDREGLVARSRALDRVLTWSFYVIPAWYSNQDRVLYWDKYDYPAVSPDRGVLVGTWWYDEEKARRLAARMAARPQAGDAGGPAPVAGR